MIIIVVLAGHNGSSPAASISVAQLLSSDWPRKHDNNHYEPNDRQRRAAAPVQFASNSTQSLTQPIVYVHTDQLPKADLGASFGWELKCGDDDYVVERRRGSKQMRTSGAKNLLAAPLEACKSVVTNRDDKDGGSQPTGSCLELAAGEEAPGDGGLSLLCDLNCRPIESPAGSQPLERPPRQPEPAMRAGSGRELDSQVSVCGGGGDDDRGQIGPPSEVIVCGDRDGDNRAAGRWDKRIDGHQPTSSRLSLEDDSAADFDDNELARVEEPAVGVYCSPGPIVEQCNLATRAIKINTLEWRQPSSETHEQTKATITSAGHNKHEYEREHPERPATTCKRLRAIGRTLKWLCRLRRANSGNESKRLKRRVERTIVKKSRQLEHQWCGGGGCKVDNHTLSGSKSHLESLGRRELTMSKSRLDDERLVVSNIIRRFQRATPTSGSGASGSDRKAADNDDDKRPRGSSSGQNKATLCKLEDVFVGSNLRQKSSSCCVTDEREILAVPDVVAETPRQQAEFCFEDSTISSAPLNNFEAKMSANPNCDDNTGDNKMNKPTTHENRFPEPESYRRDQRRYDCEIKMNPQKAAKYQLKARENWDKNIEFLLAVIGFAVDLGNVWRFPYICYKNGGGAFLIPYTVMFILGGLPIFYLEMSLGQYFSSGCLTIWRRICPMAKGIGYAMCVLNFFTSLYYNTIISWAVFFCLESFTMSDLPWTSCNNSWNQPGCRTIAQRQTARSLLTSYLATASSNSLPPINQTQIPSFDIDDATTNRLLNASSAEVQFSSPTKDYFEREVLQVYKSNGIDDLGSIRTPLAFYLAVVFVCIYFAIWKGVKSTGKAVWITALLPYFVLIPLLIRGIFLEGAWIGIKFYLYPEWPKIMDVDVWVEAAKQIYFSLGPGFGTLMALSSYNKFNHNCQKDALIAATVNYFASFISGLVIFAVLGYMATIENVGVSDVATEGPGLVFQVYPEGLATMSFSSMWSVCFFIMVITLGIDSTFGGLESVITGLCDEYPRVLRQHRGIFIGLLIVLIYLCSLPTTTYGGNYVIYVLESYGTSLSLLFIVLVETIIVCWLYGADRFCQNLEEMHGQLPGAYWRICWKYISPTILLVIFVAACGQELDKYHTLTFGDYTYPGWALTVGLLMTGSSLCCVPIYAVYYLKTKTSGSFMERIRQASTPEAGEPHKDEQRDLYVDALTNKIRDENDIHHDTVI